VQYAAMSNPDLQNQFRVAKTKSGLSWRVMVRRPRGQIQYISGFESEADAEAWIKNEGLAWVARIEEAINRV
jgi:hypothetical protein